jgi:glutathione S-transferase
MGNSAARRQLRVEQAAAAGEAAAMSVVKQVKQCQSSARGSAHVKPELIYFDGPGRGQLTRLAFAAGGIEFIDTRIAMEAWPAVKADPKSVPAKCFGSMPCVKHGEHLIAQSRATAIYAAELGLWASGRLGGDSTSEAVNGGIEMMAVGAHADLQQAMYACLFGDDDSKSQGKQQLPDAAAKILAGLERVLERRGNEGPFFFCADGPTLADLATYDAIDSPFPGLRALGIDLEPYPKVRAVVEAVAKDPMVATYLRKCSMGKPEFIYFDAPGRGQLTRLAFAAGDVDFVDTRFSMSDWPAIKADPKSVPAQCFGSVPCIKHGDVLLAQSEATATYAAKQGIWKDRLGQAGEQATNRATEMMVLGAHADLQAAMYKCLFGDDASKAKGKEALPKTVAPILQGLERAVERRSANTPFFFSEAGPTLADLATYDAFESPFPGLKALGVDVKPYPKLCTVVAAVAEDAMIKKNFTKG